MLEEEEERERWTEKMGAGASVAHELSLPAIHNNLHHVGKSMGGVKPLGGQYGEMLVHLRLVSVPLVFSTYICIIRTLPRLQTIHCDIPGRVYVRKTAVCAGTASK